MLDVYWSEEKNLQNDVIENILDRQCTHFDFGCPRECAFRPWKKILTILHDESSNRAILLGINYQYSMQQNGMKERLEYALFFSG